MAARSDATSTFEFVPADEESVASDTTNDHALLTGSIYAESSEDRDEKAVIEKMHERETFTVQIWRAMVTNVLVFTALAVTLIVHKFLADEQQKSFEQAVSTVSLYYLLCAGLVLFVVVVSLTINASSLPLLDCNSLNRPR